MKIISVAALSVLLLSGASSAAQELQRPGRAGGVFMGPGLGIGIDILGVEPLAVSAPVVGVPFSADTTTEIVEQFADGNRIELRTSGHIARDSRGRIRHDRTLTGLGPAAQSEDVRIVTITDPAAGELYRLDEARKIAWRVRRPQAAAGRTGARDRIRDRMEFSGLQQSLKTEQLGTLQLDGVKADGTRTTLLLPAGAIGNERPIEITSDRWYSPELRVVVSTKRVDPRVGEVTYRLANIDRSEPPARLFEVPAGFRVQEQAPFAVRPDPR